MRSDSVLRWSRCCATSSLCTSCCAGFSSQPARPASRTANPRVRDMRMTKLLIMRTTNAPENSGLADYLGNGVGDVLDVLRGERGDADAAGLDGVDRVFLAQPAHLLLA